MRLTAEEIKSIAGAGEGYNAEFKVRIPSKAQELALVVCAFANSEGGYLFIGIDDKGKIWGTDIDNSKRSAVQDAIRDISPAVHAEMYPVAVDTRTIWVIDVPSGKDKPHVLSGAIYVREGANSQKLTTAEEIRGFFQSSNRIYFDAVPCPRFNIEEDLDSENFKYFLLESSISGKVSTQQILNNLQAFDESGQIKNGGVLFFGRQPETFFPQAITRCVRFKGTTKVHIIDDKKYGGPLHRQYARAEAWIKDKLEVSYIIEGTGPRKEMWEIPLTVFKEAIINALSHRDYYEQGAVTMIEVYDDRVEISNPGGLLIGVKKEFGKKSMTRNPLIFGLFTRMSLVEQVASGIPRMREEMLEAGLPEPVFSTNGGFFTVEFKRPDKDTVVYFEGKPISFSDTINEDSDTINERKDTVNEDGDTINERNDTVNEDGDTINERNDTINEDGDTINLDDGIINLDDVIINPDNGIVNLDDDIVNLENGIVNPDNGIINLDDGIVNLENGIVNPDDGIINDTVNEEVSIEEILLRLIAKNEGLSAPQLSTRIGKSLSTAKRYLAKLKKSDKIEFRGAPKTGGYYLKSIHMALPPPPQSG